MAKFEIGDLVVLKSGSMRMVVEEVADDESVQTVWCNEGVIGRDRFNPALLNKWEHREDSRPGGDRPARGGGKPYGGDREGGGKPYRGGGEGGGKPYGARGGGDRDRGAEREGGDRPPRKTGWDGKPREKKFYRKEG